jgi:hypothetical protein
MKKYFILTLAIIFVLGITSCDFVTVPEQSGTTQQSGTTVQRKVLLEDYTGHKCTACPQAAVTANGLLQTYGDKLIVIGVHAGFFANPQASGQYREDFRTAAGTAYDDPTFFGVSTVGNPNGLINRKNYTPATTDHVKPYGTWATEVPLELAKPAMAKIEITNTYNSSTRSLACTIKSTFLADTLTGGPYKLIVAVTQDSIVADQLDAGVYVPTYVHRHVLRDNINSATGVTDGTWGVTIAAASAITLNVPITKNYIYTFPATYPTAGGPSSTVCDVNHCYIVAFIYNDATKEVIQVEEAKVAP